MSSPASQGALATDFALMRTVAAATDSRSAEIRALLQGFIARMAAVPPSVWSGAAATRFKNVVEQWNSESTRLCQALDTIAETIRYNERALTQAAEQHAQQIGATAADLRVS
ncbi:WXG100 family type VII secretion target [Mycolicibacterium komossense]|uniref:WXG100 family type VII secretion target n=1 Tax=Mycolicibacterium komossense TaxID=1779 RepID=A0ABT3CD50_9MYCO|nr:WXG100 family type VII secretion target [Mycolicibacterium komossense]MCV7227389.1 WXG100 family type VII secretion target [Mycolicibacterium komossense]